MQRFAVEPAGQLRAQGDRTVELKAVFAIEVLVCERCGGPRRILGAVTEPHAVRRLLAALGLAAEPPPGRPVPAV
jgi:hypothetical protein